MARILILSGAGRYDDPWHPFAESSAGIASVAEEAGHDAEVRDVVPDATADLDAFDLLVVNTGGGGPDADLSRDPDWDASHRRIDDHARAGRPLLAVHTGLNTFRDWPGWGDLLGGLWVPGTSGHPAAGIATFQAVEGAEQHPVFAGLPHGGDILPELEGTPVLTARDERYSDLVLQDGITPLLCHETRPHLQTVGWARGRTVLCDALGHDGRAYLSVARRRYLANEIDWLLAAA
jgi:uncharacterized protein